MVGHSSGCKKVNINQKCELNSKTSCTKNCLDLFDENLIKAKRN